MTGTLPETAPEFSVLLEQHAERLDLDLIERALRFSVSAHQGQQRMSGEAFVSHSIAVATILIDQLLDSTSIAAALLHDVVEDSEVRTEDLLREFGVEVAGLVDGLTKISNLTFRSTAEEQVENYRKLLLSIAKDARVIIIKLADRLHNMRTLEHLPPDRRERIATETREIYAPLAHRFGMAGVKAELEDLAFKFLEPDDYAALARQVAARRSEREALIQTLQVPLEAELRRAGIEDYDVTGRPKHLWSIFQKMRRRNTPFEEIYDMQAVRVIVKTVPDCYHVLGIIHHQWTPLQERIKDYIASPKSNAYQSLHTTIFGPGGTPLRGPDPHLGAPPDGRIRHRRPLALQGRGQGRTNSTSTSAGSASCSSCSRTPTRRRTSSSSSRSTSTRTRSSSLPRRATSSGCPRGPPPSTSPFTSTPRSGLHCQGARINGRIAPLHREIKNGDTVEILTSPHARPSRDWLAHVRTARARHRIKQWIRQEEESVSLDLGREILAREVKRRRLDDPDRGAAQPRRRGAVPARTGTA